MTFDSYASNLVQGDTNGGWDVFVRNLQSSTTSRVSIDSSGAQGDDWSYGAWISHDGRQVAFLSEASNLVAGDTNGFADVFVHDRQSGTTSRVSTDSSGAQANQLSQQPTLSADGRHVAFASYASDLVAGDTNDDRDVFVHGCGSIGTRYCAANANSTGSPAEISATCSASAAAGELTLDAVPVPNQFGIFFHGANPTQVVFGNGFLCAQGGVVRGAVIQAAGNLATYTYDNSDAQHSLAAHAGSTRHFQYWFRDPAAGGAAFNLSNSVSMDILP